jgi:hypothetical protein
MVETIGFHFLDDNKTLILNQKRREHRSSGRVRTNLEIISKYNFNL